MQAHVRNLIQQYLHQYAHSSENVRTNLRQMDTCVANMLTLMQSEFFNSVSQYELQNGSNSLSSSSSSLATSFRQRSREPNTSSSSSSSTFPLSSLMATTTTTTQPTATTQQTIIPLITLHEGTSAGSGAGAMGTNTDAFLTLIARELENNLNRVLAEATPVEVFPTLAQLHAATNCVLYSQIMTPMNTTCPITQEPFQDNEIVCELKHCKHLFSKDAFYQHYSRSVHCPVCRHDIREL